MTEKSNNVIDHKQKSVQSPGGIDGSKRQFAEMLGGLLAARWDQLSERDRETNRRSRDNSS